MTDDDIYERHVADRRFQQVVTEGLIPKLDSSMYCVSLCPDADQIDAKFCVELGAMIMMDKPIIAVVTPGQKLSKKLEMVADKIVHADIATESGRQTLMEAIKDLPGIGHD